MSTDTGNPIRRGRRIAAAGLAMALVGGGLALAQAPASAVLPAKKPMKLTLNGENFKPNQVIRASVTRAKPGCKIKVLLSGNGVSGSATEKAAADGTVEVDFDAPGPGIDYLITASVISSSCKTEVAGQSLNVLKPLVSGPKKVPAGAVVKLVASSYPPDSPITWRVKRNGKTILKGNGTTSGIGTSSQRVVANKKGNYTAIATSGSWTDDFAFVAV